MRVLLDECFPRSLRNDIPGHEIKTVAEMGWAGVKNGKLLRRSQEALDAVVRRRPDLLEARDTFDRVRGRAATNRGMR